MNNITKQIDLTKIVLFDWGNTLMVDFPDVQGKMCDWERVKVVECAREILCELSKTHQLYVATNALDSSEQDIYPALEAGLQAVWLNTSRVDFKSEPPRIVQIKNLSELLEKRD
ncbi:hypothetical protein L8S15_16030 [Vibrio sp. S/42/10]|uniref:hypothetical protein n=1 Tax=Vibrio sp. S/42/10 TaxID=2914757 RepID=UPI0024696E3E|nr:hypothetical protein [Vibrio sp. S/42/10]MDH5880600.1 hypothetical protein [Vibrio sp. S/42/10]